MKCARLNLQERSKVKIKVESPTKVKEKTRRYCQKRLVNPEYIEGPQPADIWDRFHWDLSGRGRSLETLEPDSARTQKDPDELVLTVQTLKFEGNVDENKKTRTSFKYKTNTDSNKHRMFVKQAVVDNDYDDDDRSSQLTYYFFDDYVKYLYNNDRSRPTSGKSSIFLKSMNTNFKANKATQVEITENKNVKRIEPKHKTIANKSPKQEMKDRVRDIAETIENAKISYQKSGKRKSLMISRTQSPESVQVIRVDVVCNYPTSSILQDYEETKKNETSPETQLEKRGIHDHYYANKYLLTHSYKTLDENLSGGSKVTLLCKTFKLTDRAFKVFDKSNERNRQHTKSTKNVAKGKIKQ